MEKESLVAFIDILGFGELMRSQDDKKRHQVIDLLKQLFKDNAAINVHTHELGIGKVMTFDPEVSSFSDNVVLSFPINENSEHFLYEVFRRIINACWDAVALGVAFRGGITIGRLFHDKNVVAGSALVDAVELEKETNFPRIQISQSVIEYSHSNGNKLIDDYFAETCVKKDEHEVFYLNCFNFHSSYWMYYMQKHQVYESEYNVNIEKAVNLIKLNIKENIALLAAEGKQKELLKWQWLEKEFNHELGSALWKKYIVTNNLIIGA